MFLHTIEPFGEFERHRISHAGNAFAIVPRFGCCLTDLIFEHQNVVDSYPTAAEMKENHWAKSAILVPYPNRLRDGEYQHADKKYSFPKNNAATQNSIHGFAKNAPMQVESIKLTPEKGVLTASWHYDGAVLGFPFPFLLKMSFSLTAKGNFAVEMKVTNLHHAPIPMGLGWHPYFGFALADDLKLQMPKNIQKIEIDDRMLPTGQKTDFKDFEKIKSLKGENLDNGFFIAPQGKMAKTILQNNRKRLTFWQEIGEGKWNFLQIFTPPHRQSVAIEPMTCNIDAFNNGDGLKILSTNETFGGKFGVQYKNL